MPNYVHYCLKLCELRLCKWCTVASAVSEKCIFKKSQYCWHFWQWWKKKKNQMGFFKVEDQAICTVRENDGSSQEVTQGWDYWHLNQECRPATSFKRLFFSHASIFLLSNLCGPMPLLTLLTVVTFTLKFCPWAMKKFEGWSVHLASQ